MFCFITIPFAKRGVGVPSDLHCHIALHAYLNGSALLFAQSFSMFSMLSLCLVFARQMANQYEPLFGGEFGRIRGKGRLGTEGDIDLVVADLKSFSRHVDKVSLYSRSAVAWLKLSLLVT